MIVAACVFVESMTAISTVVPVFFTLILVPRTQAIYPPAPKSTPSVVRTRHQRIPLFTITCARLVPFPATISTLVFWSRRRSDASSVKVTEV